MTVACNDVPLTEVWWCQNPGPTTGNSLIGCHSPTFYCLSVIIFNWMPTSALDTRWIPLHASACWWKYMAITYLRIIKYINNTNSQLIILSPGLQFWWFTVPLLYLTCRKPELAQNLGRPDPKQHKHTIFPAAPVCAPAASERLVVCRTILQTTRLLTAAGSAFDVFTCALLKMTLKGRYKLV